MRCRNIYKKLLCSMMGVWLLSGCVGDHPDLNSDSTKNTTKETKSSVVAYEDNDYYEDYTASDYETIDLDKQEGDLTIREGGIYVVSGTMKDGSIIVDAKKNVVRIVLAGVDLTSSHSAPIYVKDAEKVILSLQDGTVNTIQDGDSYDVDENQEPSAAIFSKDDLTINGNGTLKVIAKVKNGIQCKDTLKLMSGTYDIQAVGDGIKGKDAVWIHNGTYQITAEKDGIQTVNADHGEMIIEDGTFTIVSGQDGIQSKTSLMVYDGSFLITSGGGSTGVTQVKNPGEFYDFDEASTISQKGIKAGTTLTLKAGTYDISSIDDALHSNQALTIENGTYTISSDDDGIHADSDLNVYGGKVTIKQSYEGMEADKITVQNVNAQIKAKDDGINSGTLLTIEKGSLYVEADGDGIDSNQDVVMNGGVLVVMGPTDNGNGALDYDGDFQMNGGTLIAVGSSGMAMAPSDNSTQQSVMINLDQPLNTVLYLEDYDGNCVIGIQPKDSYSSFVFSSPDLKSGSTYHVMHGGKATSDELGVVSTATSGDKLADVTLTSSVTVYGTSGNRMRGNGIPQRP